MSGIHFSVFVANCNVWLIFKINVIKQKHTKSMHSNILKELGHLLEWIFAENVFPLTLNLTSTLTLTLKHKKLFEMT